MKNKFSTSISAIVIMLFLFCQSSFSQTTLYSQNFDSSGFNFPAGWSTFSTDSVAWRMDSTNSSNNVNASGLKNVSVKNLYGTGTYTLTSASVSTINYDNISIWFDARLTTHFPDSGSTISLFWANAADTNTWNPVTYTANDSNSLWMWANDSARIPLTGANNLAGIYVRWIANVYHEPSGTYRIDNFTVQGDISTGINETADKNATPLITVSNNLLNIQPRDFSMNKIQLTLSSIDGTQIINSELEPVSQNINLSNLSTGIYFIRLVAPEGVFVHKIVITK